MSKQTTEAEVRAILKELHEQTGFRRTADGQWEAISGATA